MTNTTGPDRFAIIPIPPGPSPTNSLFVGPLSMVMQNLPDTKARTDAMEELEAARIGAEQIQIMQDVNRGLQAAAFCDAVTHLTRRLDSYVARRTARIKADQEAKEREEQQLIEDALSKLPDPDMPTSAWPDATFSPAGDLHSAEPSEPAHEEQLQADQGDLPAEISRDPPDTDLELTKARTPSAQNPVGISW
jgi:hypothetical protein